MTRSKSDSDGRKSSKVAKNIDKYDLDESVGDELERLWTAEKPQRRSLRDLAELFNKRLLKSARATAGMSNMSEDVENLYHLLTADDVSSGMQTEARSRLERNGVNVEQLEADFVTYQAIRSYLTEYRGAEYERSAENDSVESVLSAVQRLRSRLELVVEGNLERLRSAGTLTLGEFHLFVDVDVLCEDCGAQYGVVELLDRGGCDCESDGGGG